MYDLIYLENEGDFAKAQSEAEQAFPTACIEDATDFIHPYRFSIEVDMPVEDYRLVLLDLGLALHSINFELLMMENPKKAGALVEKWKKTL